VEGVVLGLLGGVLAVIDPVPYVRDIVRGTTRPHRGTWLIWSVLGCTALASNWAAGGAWSLVVLVVQATSTVLVFALAVRRGVGGVSRGELALIGLAGAGVVGWAVSSEPLTATVFVVLADVVAAVMMVPKTWRDPWSETPSTYALSAGSGVCCTLAVGQLAADLLTYPVYFTLVNLSVTLLILGRRRCLRRGVRPLPAEVSAVRLSTDPAGIAVQGARGAARR
jgi:hypothetical protein